MATLNFLTIQLDRLVSCSPKLARAWAERLSESMPKRALALFAAAAESGDNEAAFIVGEHYLEGKGTLRHRFEAARWYHRAASAGHVHAQCRLAALHLFGLPQAAVEPNARLFGPLEIDEGADYYAALPWARSAAEAGEPDAQAMLAYILTSGPEELRDPDAAFEWYRKSAKQDCPQGRLGYAIALMMRASTVEEAVAARNELLRAAEAGLPTAHYLLGVAAERAAGAERELEARQRYKIAAEAGLGKAQMRLGLLLLEGRGGAADPLAGENWLRRAALGGDIDAAAVLGNVYARGGTSPPNYAEAAHWFRTAAEQGHRTAARALGMLYLTGAGVARDHDEAATWFNRAAEAGDQHAQADLAVLLQSGAVSALPHGPPPVQEWFERAAEQGDLVGAFNYAVCLAQGVGVPRDDGRAAFWLKRAAEGVVNAQYWYGCMLAEGRGVAKDDVAACSWYARAAEAGMAEAQVALAESYVNGRGVPCDHQLAKSWFLRAVSAGHAGAMFALGALYGGGHNIETDRTEARCWFAQAAEHGHPIAALMLARYAVRGLGGPLDVEVGRRWYVCAALLGSTEATDELAELDRVLAADTGTTAAKTEEALKQTIPDSAHAAGE